MSFVHNVHLDSNEIIRPPVVFSSPSRTQVWLKPEFWWWFVDSRPAAENILSTLTEPLEMLNRMLATLARQGKRHGVSFSKLNQYCVWVLPWGWELLFNFTFGFSRYGMCCCCCSLQYDPKLLSFFFSFFFWFRLRILHGCGWGCRSQMSPGFGSFPLTSLMRR